jgi:4'-phosphopantetheinyl transferase
VVPKATSEKGSGTVETKPEDFVARFIPLNRQDLPAAGEAHVWLLDLGRLARPLRGALDGHLGADDLAPFTGGQLRFARRFFLRLLLGAYLDLPGKAVSINRSNRGKPVLDATVHKEVLHFSMAKSEDRLLLGFATSFHLGVDLEPARRRAFNPLGVARRYFTDSEYSALAAMAPAELDAAFLRTWACKEAVVKASGQGIANQFCRFSVETNPARPAVVLDYDGEQAPGWSLALMHPDTGFLGAVAAPFAGLRIQAFRLLPVTVCADG